MIKKKFLNMLSTKTVIPPQIDMLIDIKRNKDGIQFMIIRELWNSKKVLTKSALYAKLQNIPEAKSKIKSFNHFKNFLLPYMIKKGKLYRGRADDFPKYKKSGFKVNPSKALKNIYPKDIYDLTPFPLLRRKDLIMYCLRKGTAYKYYPEEDHDLIDEINLEYKMIHQDWDETIKHIEVNAKVPKTNIYTESMIEAKTYPEFVYEKNIDNEFEHVEAYVDNLSEIYEKYGDELLKLRFPPGENRNAKAYEEFDSEMKKTFNKKIKHKNNDL